MECTYLKLKDLADSISEEIKNEVQRFSSEIKIVSIILGDDPASLSYLNGMKRRAEKLGIILEISQYEINLEEKKLLEQIDKINNDSSYSGLIIQVPLPKHISSQKAAESISWKKDLDGVSPFNIGLLFRNDPFIIPATAQAVDIALNFIAKKYDIILQGKNAAIIGRSLTVGKPLVSLLLNKNITPVILHTKTIEPQNITKAMDIIVAACGVPEFVNDKWVGEGAVVIDVGIHSIDEPDSDKGYRLCGDVHAESVRKKASILTAVPGGIGSLTSTLIFANALKSYNMINKNCKFKFSFES